VVSLRRQPPAYSPLTLADLAAVPLALREATLQLRTLLAGHFQATEVLATASGTEALTLALRLATGDGTRGRRVALPAYSCYSVASAAVGAEVEVLLYDLDPGSLSPDLTSLESALQAGAGTVVISPLFGLPVDWFQVSRLVRAYGALLLEDAAQAGGGSWDGQPLGSLGDLSVLSFGRGKGWTGGGGGALLGRGEAPKLPGELPRGGGGGAAWVRSAVQWAMGRPAVYGIPASLPFLRLGETIYHAPRLPSSIPPATAALAFRTARHQPAELVARRQAAAWFGERLGGVAAAGRIVPIRREEGGWLRYPLRIPGGVAGLPNAREAKQLGIAGGYPRPLPLLAPLQPLILGRWDPPPGARELAGALVTLPTHSRLGPPEREAVARLLDAVPERPAATAEPSRRKAP